MRFQFEELNKWLKIACELTCTKALQPHRHHRHSCLRGTQRPFCCALRAEDTDSAWGRSIDAAEQRRANRLRAKAQIAAQAASQQARRGDPIGGREGPSSRPLDTRGGPSTSRNAATSPDEPPSKRARTGGEEQLPRDASLGKYIDFDLSKLEDTHGGYLLPEAPARGEMETSLEARVRRLEEQRAQQELSIERAKENRIPGVDLDVESAERCVECGSPELDASINRYFGVKVCRRCSKENPDKYSLLTKTEVQADYLLTDSELRDPELLPHQLKANPHSASYSNMMLFLRCQVEAYAFSDDKWGSEAALDAELDRRAQERAEKRSKKFQQRLHLLRTRTKTAKFADRISQRHEHDFQPDPNHPEGGWEECVDCGLKVEVEHF